MSDLISRQAAIDAIMHNQKVYSNHFGSDPIDRYTVAIIDNDAQSIAQLPSVQPETCEGCKHLSKWENEVEYGYPSPCTRCKRRANDNYEQ